MNAIEQKLLNKYQQFVDEKGTRTPIAVNVFSCNGRIRILPQATNAITISLEN